MPASTTWGGESKSGSPTPRLITSGMVAITSKNLRMPDGGTDSTRWARRWRVAGACGSVVIARVYEGTPSDPDRRGRLASRARA